MCGSMGKAASQLSVSAIEKPRASLHRTGVYRTRPVTPTVPCGQQEELQEAVDKVGNSAARTSIEVGSSAFDNGG